MKLKIFLIFALITLAFSCEETCQIQQCKPMVMSDASPVQFWPVNCETWNQQRPAGMHHYCFCHPWQCDDEIKIPFSGDVVSFEQPVSFFDTDMDGWTQPAGGSSPNWAWSGDFGGSAKVTSIATFGPKTITLSPPRIPVGKSFYIRIKYSIDDSGTSPFPKLRITIRNASNTLRYDSGNFLGSTGGLQVTETVLVSTPITDGDKIELTPRSTGDVWGAGDIFHVIEISYIYDVNQEYVLTAYDEDDNLLLTEEFIGLNGSNEDLIASFTPSEYDICDEQISLKISSKLALTPLAGWFNVDAGGGPAWSLGSNPFVVLTGPGPYYSDALTTFVDSFGDIVPSGGYNFSYNFATGIDVLPGDLAILIDLRVDNFSVGNQQTVLSAGEQNFSGIINIPASDVPNNIKIQFFKGSESVEYIAALVSFDVVNEGVQLYKSDCLNIKELHAETLIIDYTNHENFDGINYGDATPDPSFKVRIPAIFFEQRFIQEGQDDKLSNGEVISLYQESKEQCLLSTDRMPHYMHRKILAVLQHQFLYIDGNYWIKGGEEYAKTEKKNKRDSFAMYTCWLTKQSSLVRNIL